MAFLKAIWKGHSKHKKLSDEWDLEPKAEIEMETPGSTIDGITFNVKYLGSTGVIMPSNAKATAEAVKKIVTKARMKNRQANPSLFAVNLRGVSVIDLQTKSHLMDVSLYRISYCSADATYGNVFAFIATNENEDLECHAFLCQKRKVAQMVSITVAQTFNTAYHLWEMSHTNQKTQPKPPEEKKDMKSGCLKKPESESKPRPSVLQQVLSPVPMLIDLTTPIEEKPPLQWTRFED